MTSTRKSVTNQDIWGREISNQKQKEQAAKAVAKRLKNGDVVGVGSGSTSFLTLKALVERRGSKNLEFRAIPTSIEMELACKSLSVPTTMLSVEQPDWSFDGADEVDGSGNMIKGRGGAMLREKMLIQACPEVYLVIDASKKVKHLGQNFPVPVEIHPQAVGIVRKSLEKLEGVTTIELRPAVGKDGPIITENGNLIFDVKFSKIIESTERDLKAIVGVVETGLFIGYKPKIVMSD